MAKLSDYLPDYYDDIVEMHSLVNAEQVAVDANTDQLNRILMNQYVFTADAQGLSLFEYQLGITPESGATLEERRYDILMRILPPQPITIGYFRSLVKAMQIPADIEVDAINSILSTISLEADVSVTQIKRLRYLLNVYVPANLTYQITTRRTERTVEQFNAGQAVQVAVATSVDAEPVSFMLLADEIMRVGTVQHVTVNTSVTAESTQLKEVS
ncbi:putative phage tail protein [Lactiplantibacillus paraplantarum]|uniref:DUF2313 domain-containing protein n=1 Tax=Lactiplantibacillus paraplantarum TaxID=60520 RepID=A0AAD0TQG9_9LACO|nr:putative phage tail protein [Lactiplantibacillus paraplantarum]AYJ38867.1 DUF2313 domain-containing protein [Lactiplantibacillus paraplantarum]AYJ38921.1 DUF2313 domain-containing protein [Lactiplantibacillus paraplantarum]KRL51366.1 hypothetical protein FD48_GL000046 [Lactiplantibacillus paraplantarum DSM 10667]MCU4683958.1 YmfQ family protein [Lactiplantibacillus paraplantarum]MDL2061106.1 DUF2313 domain-containing protein [Lactiplantibacillus paraplantarum]